MGRRRHNGDLLFFHRMDEDDLPGMEVDSPIGIGAGKAVLQVTLDVKSDGGKLRPDLMVAPCVKRDLKQVVLVACPDELIVEAGDLAALYLFGYATLLLFALLRTM